MKLIRSKVTITYCLLFIFLVLTVGTLIYSYCINLNRIKEISYLTLEKAIHNSNARPDGSGKRITRTIPKTEIYQNRIQIFKDRNHIYDHYKDSILYFTDNENWEYRTFFGQDTILSRIVNKKKNIFIEELTLQTLSLIDQTLKIDPIIEEYFKLLTENKILLSDPVHLSVKSNIYNNLQKKSYNREEDIRYNYITPVFYTGYLDDIEYQAYLYISFKTVYGMLPQYYLHPLYIILFILFIASLYYHLEDRRKKKDTGITDLGEDTFSLGHVTFDYKKKQLSYEETIEMRSRIADLLLMFLQDKDHQLNRDFLVTYFGSDTNMSTAVNLLRKNLKRATCRYTLNSYRQLGVYKLEIPPRKSLRSYLGHPKKWWKKLKRIVSNFELE